MPEARVTVVDLPSRDKAKELELLSMVTDEPIVPPAVIEAWVAAWVMLASLPRMLLGMLNTVGITALVLVFGLALAIPITLARMSPRPLFNLPAAWFVLFFRGTPAA